MRDPDRIRDVLDAIRRVWEKYPDLRLGQLILNAVPWSSQAASKGDAFPTENAFLADRERGLYAMEEDELRRRLAIVYRDAYDDGEE